MRDNESRHARRRPSKQDPRQVLGNQSTLMESELLEQDGNELDVRTRLCYKA